ncbi:MAG TPA: IS4 family transposase, partial [Ramlibacter sp.]|nr:IS4 family transposase [Ramlibacter sp.]
GGIGPLISWRRAMAGKPAGLPRGARISDFVSLGVLTTTLPPDLIDRVLASTGRHSVRQRQLPARLVVYYVVALALYAQASSTEVLRCLLDGIRWLRLGAQGLPIACKSAITQARERLGAEPLKQLYAAVARPLALPSTPGAWYREHRLVSLDGTTLELPDTPALEEHYGRPGAARGTSACPQLRLLTLVETGTRAVIAAAFGPYRTAETALVRHVLPQLRPGMLCLADRGFSGRALWRQAAGTGADLLWWVRGDRILPCLKALPDGSYLSALYASARHRRQDRGGIRVRVIDYRLAGVAEAEPMYRLITTLLDPTSAAQSGENEQAVRSKLNSAYGGNRTGRTAA